MVVIRKQEGIGKKFIESKLIEEDVLEKLKLEAQSRNENLVDVIIEKGYVAPEDAIDIVADYIGVKGKVIDTASINFQAFETLDDNFMKDNIVIPFNLVEGKISVATHDPTNLALVDQIQLRTTCSVKIFFCTKNLILKAIDEVKELKANKSNKKVESVLEELGSSDTEELMVAEEKIEDIERGFGSENALVVRGINAIIAKAIKMKASDIHIEPYDKDIRVRYRIDGILMEVRRMSKNLTNGLISRIKIMANLDIADRRLPQDGRFRIKTSGRYVDFRVSTMPTRHGEKAVLRILDRESVDLDLDKLGFLDEDLRSLEKIIRSPHGIILVTGPTGSGKSTTLYSILNTLNTEKVNISTAEDPIEYELEGINQVQCKSEIGLTFANTLRSFLRQDPDIIMVGEIRDTETSEIAIKAALTGHLVLSTLHTNDAPSSIHRLINMGVEPFMISASILMIQAQRLVRKLCSCKEEDELALKRLKILGLDSEKYNNIKFYKNIGCKKCNYSGYKGRAAIYELMIMSEELRKLVANRATTNEIRKKSIEQGMKTLKETGVEKAALGVTSLEEVLRITLE